MADKRWWGKALFIQCLPAAGPVCNDFRDVELFMETVIDASPHEYDSNAHEVPWKPLEHDAGRKLTIGILAEDLFFPLHAPVRRALSSAAAKLREAGHALIPFPHDPDNSISLANDMMLKYYQADPERSQLKAFEDGRELILPSVLSMNCLGTSGDWVATSVSGLAAMNRKRIDMSEFWRKIWMDNKLDVLLSSPCQSTAVKHDAYKYIAYPTLWNLLDVR
jgi:amidase